MTGASAGRSGARQLSIKGQVAASHTVEISRIDKPPHRGKQGKERLVVLEQAACSVGRDPLLGHHTLNGLSLGIVPGRSG